MPVNVRCLFFGATAGAVGKRLVEISMPDGSTARNGFDKVKDEFPGLTEHKLLFSINQQYATGSELLKPGDELAVFTAVSGG